MNALEAMHWSAVAASEADDAEWEETAEQLDRDMRNPWLMTATAAEVGACINGNKIDELLPLMARKDKQAAAVEFYNHFYNRVYLPAFQETVQARIKANAEYQSRFRSADSE